MTQQNFSGDHPTPLKTPAPKVEVLEAPLFLIQQRQDKTLHLFYLDAEKTDRHSRMHTGRQADKQAYTEAYKETAGYRYCTQPPTHPPVVVGYSINVTSVKPTRSQATHVAVPT